MSQTERDDAGPPDDRDRYGQFSNGEATIVYDRRNTSCWLQSDTIVELAEMC